MEKMDLSKKVLASLLTMSCVYLGGTSVLPTAGAAENAADNNVGQLITNGGSLTGGDVFNFTSESTANSTAFSMVRTACMYWNIRQTNGTSTVIMPALRTEFFTGLQ